MKDIRENCFTALHQCMSYFTHANQGILIDKEDAVGPPVSRAYIKNSVYGTGQCS